MLILQLCTAY